MKNIKTTISSLFIVLICTSMLTVSGCKTAAMAQDVPELSDAEIASVGLTANMVDLIHAKIALQRSENVAIRTFAHMMISDHVPYIQEAVNVVTDLGFTPEDNALSEKILKHANKATEKLKSIDSSEFNEYYIKNEINYHKAKIHALKNVLIPQTENEQLKSLLKKLVPILQYHVKLAKYIQENNSTM